jgi:iron complex transport system permease protein
LAFALFLISLIALLAGRYPVPGLISPQQIISDEFALRLFMNLRLPRLLASLLLGTSLATAGMVFQMLFNNPLIEPGFLGVSQGAAFGAALCIVFLGGSGVAIQILAIVFAFLGLWSSYLLARRIRYGGWVLRLVLSGITISALFSAGLGLLKYLADPLSQLPEITFWLLGGLSGITWGKLLAILPGVLIGLLVLYLYRWRLNLLSLNEDIAFSLGASPRRERLLLLGAAVLATASVISVAGMVGWVGLIIPHLARRMTGSDSRLALPAALLMGGIFTVFCDTLARSLLPGEIPLGILTSLLGAIIFLILMTTREFRIQR